MTPFEQAIGPQFHHLNSQIRQMHGGRAPAWRGQVSVQGASGLLGRFAAWFAGFPGELEAVEFALDITTGADGCETWTRRFGDHKTVSQLLHGEAGQMREAFGPISLTLAPIVKVDALHVNVIAAHMFGRFALPAMLRPRSEAKIWQDEAGRYRFDIEGSLPIFGRVVRYRGWARPDVQSQFVRA